MQGKQYDLQFHCDSLC